MKLLRCRIHLESISTLTEFTSILKTKLCWSKLCLWQNLSMAFLKTECPILSLMEITCLWQKRDLRLPYLISNLCHQHRCGYHIFYCSLFLCLRRFAIHDFHAVLIHHQWTGALHLWNNHSQGRYNRMSPHWLRRSGN